MTYSVKDLGGDPAIRANILRLNNENARETSPLDADKLDRMIATARVATIVVPGIAFLLAFDQGADYDSWNFIWGLREVVWVISGPVRGAAACT